MLVPSSKWESVVFNGWASHVVFGNLVRDALSERGRGLRGTACLGSLCARFVYALKSSLTKAIHSLVPVEDNRDARRPHFLVTPGRRLILLNIVFLERNTF